MTDRSESHHALATRRDVIAGGAALPLLATSLPSEAALAGSPGSATSMTVTLIVNGQRRQLDVDPRTTLLDALREHLGLTGSKKGCDHGQCGACTVLAQGRRMNACLSLAVMHEGEAITTIEGLGTPDKQHRMQDAFVRHDGFQCGYCTPGQIMSAVAMLEEARAGWASHVTADLSTPSPLADEEIRERMSGNLCRCAAYRNILAAIKDAGDVA